MGLISFIRDAGEKLFGKGEAKAATEAVTAQPTEANLASLNLAAGNAIRAYMVSLGLPAETLSIGFDGKTNIVSLGGSVPDQETREKIVLAAGNVENVASVDDQLTVSQPADESKYYTVVRGDTLSKIAKEYYGNANAYMKIFEANRPMLGHPDKIYPGQVLRIPA